VYQGLEGKPADACIEATALYSVVWAFEASLPQKARAFFNILVRQMSARTLTYTKVRGWTKLPSGFACVYATLCVCDYNWQMVRQPILPIFPSCHSAE